MGGRFHDDRVFRKAAPVITAAAYANPDYRCPCGDCDGLTLTEARRADPEDEWDCGHIIDGNHSGGFQAELRSCNRRAGANMVNARRQSSYDW